MVGGCQWHHVKTIMADGGPSVLEETSDAGVAENSDWKPHSSFLFCRPNLAVISVQLRWAKLTLHGAILGRAPCRHT